MRKSVEFMKSLIEDGWKYDPSSKSFVQQGREIYLADIEDLLYLDMIEVWEEDTSHLYHVDHSLERGWHLGEEDK